VTDACAAACEPLKVTALLLGSGTPFADTTIEWGASPMTKTQVEVSPSLLRRRRWSKAEKERIVAAAMEPGAIVSAVAREAGIQASQLFRWRQQLHGARFASLPVEAPTDAAPLAASSPPLPPAVLEIEFATGVRRGSAVLWRLRLCRRSYRLWRIVGGSDHAGPERTARCRTSAPRRPRPAEGYIVSVGRTLVMPSRTPSVVRLAAIRVDESQPGNEITCAPAHYGVVITGGVIMGVAPVNTAVVAAPPLIKFLRVYALMA
jgi:transposase